MLAKDLYQTLNNDGVQLWIEGDKLRFAPKEKITPILLAELKANKSELMILLLQRKYAHLVTCQQCEHLTATGYCGVRPQYKPMIEAMRDCESFKTA